MSACGPTPPAFAKLQKEVIAPRDNIVHAVKDET